MMNFIKAYTLFLFIAMLFCLFDEKNSLAQEDNSTDVLKIQSDPKVDSLMELQDFVEAEKIAREKKLDTRVIATIMAYAGKKDEAFAMLFELIRTVPEDIRKKVALQMVNVIAGAGESLGKEFFDELIRQKLLSLSEHETLCREVETLVRDNQIERAEILFEQLLDSTYAEKELVYVAMTLITRMNSIGHKEEKVKIFLDKLLKKFPANLSLRLRRIGSLAAHNPLEVLAELNSMKKNHPEFYTESEFFIHLLRAEAFENLGERERAKLEYSMIVDLDFSETAQGKLNEYQARERLERELQEKIAKVNEPKHNISPRSPHRFWLILAINIIFIAMIVYKIYGQKWRQQ